MTLTCDMTSGRGNVSSVGSKSSEAIAPQLENLYTGLCTQTLTAVNSTAPRIGPELEPCTELYVECSDDPTNPESVACHSPDLPKQTRSCAAAGESGWETQDSRPHPVR